MLAMDVLVTLWLPVELLTVNVASYVPGAAYITWGIESVDVAGVPPGNDHDQAVGCPFQERSLNWMLPPAQAKVFSQIKSAMGAQSAAGPAVPVKARLAADQSVLRPP